MRKLNNKNVFIFEDDESEFYRIRDFLTERGYIVYPSSKEEFIDFKRLFRNYLGSDSDNTVRQIVERFRLHNPLFFIMDLDLSNRAWTFTVGGTNKIGGTIRTNVILPAFPFIPCIFFTRFEASTASEYMQAQDHKVAKGNYARHLRQKFWSEKFGPIIKSIENNSTEYD